MGRREEMVGRAKELMTDLGHIRNIGIVAHIDHGKTTMSDNLIAGAGMMSKELAGKQLVLDFHEDEQARGITIDAANISIVYDYKDEHHLINIIDTPGHVDFSGDVTRAMRAVDGVVVVICAVEGCMPQTETVIRQALKEKAKPTIFINKVDRLINELQVSPEEMQNRFARIISKANKMIEKYAPEEHKKDWQVKPENGAVAFGSAYHNWAISVPYMKRSGVSFKEIYDHCTGETQKELADKSPLHEVILEMVIAHLPNPESAQVYRVPQIWKGDLESSVGKAMVKCDREGKLAMMVTDVTIDPHAGPVATARVFSGTVTKGQQVNLVNASRNAAIQQVGIYMGAERINVEKVPAGNIVALTGLRDAFAGETVSSESMESFEEMKHFSEAVITKSIEAKNTSDLPKLIEILRQVAKEDPTIKIEINEETGEHLISGMGELHLEVIEDRIRKNKNLDVVTSKPIVVYRETASNVSQQMEGKSPNRHNRFYIIVEPMEEKTYEAITNSELHETLLKKQPKEFTQRLRDLGYDKTESKSTWDIYNNNLFLDMTKGVQYLNETKELLVQGFREAMDNGPLAGEKCTKMKVKLMDATLHEDAVHRGPAQVLPAIKRPIYAAMLQATAILLEPKQKVFINVPQELMGAVSKDLQGRRGKLENMEQEGDNINIVGNVPIVEMFGFSGDIRSATQGKALWSTEYIGYEKLPNELQRKIILSIRERKGLKPEIPQAKDFMEQ
jgi:elongation factor 2